ncbi:response regulator [bacterium]|nr:response regulator [bacterium]
MSKKRILVADNNLTTLEFLATALKKLGYEVITSGDGVQALELANRTAPDLIIAELQLPEMSGVELCWMIRRHSKISTVPFILLSMQDEQEVRLNSYRSGVDVYLIRPVSLRELTVRIDTLLYRFERLRTTTMENRRVFSGELSDFSIVELLQLLNMSKKTGTLWLSQGCQRGCIYLKDGELKSALLGEQRGEKAIYSLMQWKYGQFDFESSQREEPTTITKATMEIILECSKRLDEEKMAVTS